MIKPAGFHPQICVGCGKPNVPTGYLPSWANRADSHDGVAALGLDTVTDSKKGSNSLVFGGAFDVNRYTRPERGGFIPFGI